MSKKISSIERLTKLESYMGLVSGGGHIPIQLECDDTVPKSLSLKHEAYRQAAKELDDEWKKVTGKKLF